MSEGFINNKKSKEPQNIWDHIWDNKTIDLCFTVQ